ncbi:VWA domain-containing protein [Natronomonas salina]|uniref:VWA domain-containing protein n=1 Tax=Natronomonas salina TaxID=1710540 RepID=UPI0015B58A4B|nr:VWA domain-containing protein [Natronomonas salina]QLD89838.1 VWA domain-containing protein [Natronomonas salina]
MFEFAETKSVSTPFGAVVGQEPLKEALLAVATDDGLDGLLVSGEKGTAKSTLVRGLADLLPDQRAVADCPYGCPPGDRSRQCEGCRDRAAFPVEERSVPLVTLPLGATRERVVGTLSVSDALAGVAEFDPGLLARANRGILYVDEVNLLDDHLVDVLLDAAAAGENRVERDGVSVSHPAEFTLVGTMNPEEGDLRPQLRDRFALSVEVRGERDLEDRVAIIDGDLREAVGDDDTADQRRRLRHGRDMLDAVALTDDQKREIAELCLNAGVDGHRADIAAARAARALAALDGRPTVTDGDLRRAAELALGHRMRSAPFEDAPDADEVVDDHFEDESGNGDPDPGGGDGESDAEEAGGPEADEPGDDDSEPGEGTDPDGWSGDEAGSEAPPPDDDEVGDDGSTPASDPTPADAETADDGPDEPDDASGNTGEEATPIVPGQPRHEPGAAGAPDLDAPETEGSSGPGSARSAPSTGNRGARVRTESTDGASGVDAAASVRAAASRGADRVEKRDLRRSVRSGDGEALVVFAVDASASMRSAMRTAKGVTLELLEDAYTERDSVAVVAFAGEDAEVLLPPTDSVTLASRHLKDLPTGDRTPLPAGLRSAAEVVDRADPEAAVVVLVSDGRANAVADPTADTRSAAAALASTGARVVCVDAGSERGLLDDVVAATDGERVPLDALTPERVEAAVTASRR